MPFFLKDLTVLRRQFAFAAFFWFLLALIAIIVQLIKGPASINNFLIYKGVFWHTTEQLNLYSLYPAEYKDSIYYGPVFSIVIAPFALLPTVIGCFLWGLANAAFLFFAVRKLPVNRNQQNIVLLAGAVEMMTSMHNLQFNPMLCSWIVLAYAFVKKEKDVWATLFIALGILTKLYGVIGLAFFLFSNHKLKFIVSFICWMGILVLLPALLSSPAFIIQSYQDWYHAVIHKNDLNTVSTMQDVSVMRIIRNVFNISLANTLVLSVVALMHLTPLLRYREWKHTGFQLRYLALLLIGVVIFSSSAESPTYVIAMIGVGIWYANHENKKSWPLALLLFALLLTSLSTTDLFPSSVKVDYIRPYGLKALPCFLVWLVIWGELMVVKRLKG